MEIKWHYNSNKPEPEARTARKPERSQNRLRNPEQKNKPEHIRSPHGYAVFLYAPKFGITYMFAPVGFLTFNLPPIVETYGREIGKNR